MKILTLSLILMLGVMMAGSAVVSAAVPTNPYFTNPSNEEHVRGDVNVQWLNPLNRAGYYFQYQEEDCSYAFAKTEGWTDIGPLGSSNLNYVLSTIGFSNSELCLRLGDSDDTYDYITVLVDNEAPEVVIEEVFDSGLNPDIANEKDIKTKVEYESSDNEGVVSCEIAWGDGDTWNCDTSSGVHTKQHQYGDNGDYTVVVTVEDIAGNSASDSVVVTVENVDPTVDSAIDAPNNGDVDSDGVDEAYTGESVLFVASGDDVTVDLDAGLNCTWSFDGTGSVDVTADSNGDCSVNHAFSEMGVHTVDLTITDKDGGSVDATQFKIEIAELTHLIPMQQVVVGNVLSMDFDNADTNANGKRFKTDIQGITNCDDVAIPTGMATSAADGNKCKVDYQPVSGDEGVYNVVVKAYNSSGDYKYYSFDVTVYTWGINLVPGWNLISIPLMPVDTSINSVFADIIENVAYEGTSAYTVYQYDAVTDNWYRARKYNTNSGFTATSSKLSDIVPGYGYWIKMNNSDTIYGTAEAFLVNNAPGTSGIDLATGSWNLIGRFGTNPNALNWKQAFKYVRKDYYPDNYVVSSTDIWSLVNVTPSGVTSWDNSGTTLNVAEGYWVRTASGSQGLSTVEYEPNTISN